MPAITALLLVLALVGCAFWFVAWRLAGVYFSHTLPFCDQFTPRVSILKPVKGIDACMYENLVSFCRQDYGDYEILFGCGDAHDPAVELVHRLQKEFPNRAIRLVVADDNDVNPKTALLRHLAAQAQGRVLVISDSDIRVSGQYLRQVVAPLKDSAVGLVTCPYQAGAIDSFAARLEAMYIDAAFLPSVLVAGRLVGTHFAMGSTMAFRREDLEAIGGFEAFLDGALDDLQLGMRMGALGKAVHLSEYVVQSTLGKTSFGQQWRREVRWARSIRYSRWQNFVGVLPTFAVVWAGLLAAASGLSPASLAVLGGVLALRWMVAWRVRRGLGCRLTWVDAALLPLRDVLTAVVWCVAARPPCRMARPAISSASRRANPAVPPAGDGLLRRGVRRLDRFLRGMEGIREFSTDPQCLLRISPGHAANAVRLSDGATCIRASSRGICICGTSTFPPCRRGGQLSPGPVSCASSYACL